MVIYKNVHNYIYIYIYILYTRVSPPVFSISLWSYNIILSSDLWVSVSVALYLYIFLFTRYRYPASLPRSCDHMVGWACITRWTNQSRHEKKEENINSQAGNSVNSFQTVLKIVLISHLRMRAYLDFTFLCVGYYIEAQNSPSRIITQEHQRDRVMWGGD